jgi:hypothetical protein
MNEFRRWARHHLVHSAGECETAELSPAARRHVPAQHRINVTYARLPTVVFTESRAPSARDSMTQFTVA